MTIQYQIDGSIFREITTNWLCASVNESLIKARQLDTDQAGNTVEYFRLNDGRVFTRLVAPSSRSVDDLGSSNSHSWNMRPAMLDHSITQPR